ncbi:MAG: SH3 domain-containing protein [Alphaproteobacteria bacterium]|jgi:uncharacterized protein YraI|nr:SH3 domain-containing protein [Alphaproteobacteria bacterium]
MFKRILLTAAVLVATSTASMAAGTGWTTGSVNFRDGPGAYYAKIGSIARCASVQLDYVQNGWYRVQWNGRWGWVAQRYITDSSAYCSGGSYTKHSGGGY